VKSVRRGASLIAFSGVARGSLAVCFQGKLGCLMLFVYLLQTRDKWRGVLG
jgi:hypothetical protein